MKKIELDVTFLIARIKQENLMFYPVMMSLILSALDKEEDDIFFELSKGHFLKTKFHPEFEKFYQNYVFDCYQNQKRTQIPLEKILFALDNQNKRADFILCAFKKKDGKIILPIYARHELNEDFQDKCQKSCLCF